jgi:hypothetical protein
VKHHPRIYTFQESSMNDIRKLYLAFASLTMMAAAAQAGSLYSGDDETVAERRLTASPQAFASCLQHNSNRPSYPSGVGPQNMFRFESGNGVVLEQWFQHRSGDWRTSFDVMADASGSIVRVRMPGGLSSTDGYRRAANEIIDYCAANGAG